MHAVSDSPFYRVSVKGIVRDAGRVLVVQNHKGFYEMPGGGWEHGESLREAFEREIQEELGVGVTSISNILYTYQHPSDRGYVALRLMVEATLDAHTFTSRDDEIIAAKFVTQEELQNLEWAPSEALSADIIEQIFAQA